jgi:hypothetical protein
MAAMMQASDDEIGGALAKAEPSGELSAAGTTGVAESLSMQPPHRIASGDVTTAEQRLHAGKLPK